MLQSPNAEEFLKTPVFFCTLLSLPFPPPKSSNTIPLALLASQLFILVTLLQNTFAVCLLKAVHVSLKQWLHFTTGSVVVNIFNFS